MKLGTLEFREVKTNLNLVAAPVKDMIEHQNIPNVYVAAINPNLSDTAAFCAEYDIGLDVSANCVIVEAKRADRVWYAACIILATDKIDVNGIVRKHLGARKTGFAPMDRAVELTSMEYGGITPIGLPIDWPILVDSNVANTNKVIIGTGVRKSKLLVNGKLLAELPKAIILAISKPA